MQEGERGEGLEGWEATGFSAGLQWFWDGMGNRTMIVHVPACGGIMINYSGIYFSGQS